MKPGIGNVFCIALAAAIAVALAGCTGSSNTPKTFTQFDRVARPGVNLVFATVAPSSGGGSGRHQVNNTDNPTDDNGQLSNDIDLFATHAAGRSSATSTALKKLLVPDVMKVDLSQMGVPAAYLGVETIGQTGSRFGGRALADDVMDTTLGLAFGNNLVIYGFAADDGAEHPTLVADSVTALTDPKHFQDGSAGFGAAQFPYLGPPQ